jgi:hypothetical protein
VKPDGHSKVRRLIEDARREQRRAVLSASGVAFVLGLIVGHFA